MKTLIAKACIWILGKLGYDNKYSLINQITITVDAKDAINDIDKLVRHLKILKAETDGL